LEIFLIYEFFNKGGWVDVDRLVCALPLVTFFFSPIESRRSSFESRASHFWLSVISSSSRTAQGRNRRVHWEEWRPCQRLRRRVFDQWLYTDWRPISPESLKKAIWPVSSDSKVFVAMVWVWSEDQWVRSKKGISSSLATPTNVVDCVPGGHFLHFVGTGNNRSWPRSFSCYFTSWNGILLMIVTQAKEKRMGPEGTLFLLF